MNQLDYCLMNPLQKFGYWLLHALQAVPGRVVSGGKAFCRGVVSMGKGFGRGVVNLGTMFGKGDLFVKLSYLIMGLGSLVRGQVVKGLLYLGAEIGFFAVFFGFGWKYLQDLFTLGTSVQEVIGHTPLGTPLYAEMDNSMLILLYSVMMLLVAAAFLFIWNANLKSAYKACEAHRRGEKLPGIKGDLAALMDEKYHVTMLAVPTLLAAAFVILPLIFMVLIAFTNYDSNHQPPGNLFTWVGFENFKDVLWDDPLKSYTFRHLLQWTVIWAIFATFTNYIFGMLLAIIINKKGIKFKKLWRTIFVLTIAVPQFVSLLIMSKIFYDQGTGGPVNVILQSLGFEMVHFLSDPVLARITVIFVNMWVGIPYSMLITSGILMNIPADLYESARIDGAGPVKQFTKITMPYMLFVTTPYLITQFVGNFNNFNVIYLLTQGNPKSLSLYQAGETDLLVTWLYKLTVNFSDYNLASVIGILVFIISAVLSLIVYNSSSSMKNEEAFQ